MSSERVLVFDRTKTDLEFRPEMMISKTETKEEYCKQISKYIGFLSRDKVESDPEFLQIIPYVVFKDKSSLLGYRRTKKSGEKRLQEKVSVGIGGHINFEDTIASVWGDLPQGDPEDLLNTVVNAAAREVNEEFLLWGGAYKDFVFKDKLPNYILYDGRDPVGRVHLGMVYIIETPHLEKIIPNENCVAEPFRMDHKEWSKTIVAKEYMKVEGWSRMVIHQIIRDKDGV